MHTELTSRQRRFLKAHAHHMRPLAQVGKGGVSSAFIKEVGQLLHDHELVKVKFNEFKEDKSDLVDTLTGALQAQIIGLIGNTAILFRRNPDARLQRITLE